CPRADRGAVDSLRRGSAGTPSPASPAGSTAGRDERREGVGELGPVRGSEVDFVAHPVDPERDGMSVRRTVDVVCYYYGNISSHDTDPAKRDGSAQHNFPGKDFILQNFRPARQTLPAAPESSAARPVAPVIC